MTSDVASTEVELIEQAAAGDWSAFGEVYTRYLDAIYRYIYYRVSDPRDAEDLTETVFLKAWLGLPNYHHMGLRFSSWLYRIAHNVVIDFHRKQKADPCIPQQWIAGDEDVIPSIATGFSLTELEDASALSQAIMQLNEEEQQIILLRFIEGLSHAEVAEILNKSEGACRMLQNRALVALSRKLNGSSY